jgi:hypothetical protein
MRRTRAVLAGFLLLVLLAGPATWAQSADDDSSVVVAAWDVTAGTPVPDSSVRVPRSRRATYDRVEAYVWSAIPADLRPRIARLELFVVDPDAEDPSDGTVIETDDETGWILALDEKEGEAAVAGDSQDDQGVFDTVIVHELGHVLSLSQDQMAADGVRGTYKVEEGTLRPDSWLNAFYVAFWKNRYPGWKDNEDPDQAAALYDDHPDAFVTDYAATSPVEDFAETFTTFVVESRPAGTAERDRKVLFFWQIPALVREREVLRKGLPSVN